MNQEEALDWLFRHLGLSVRGFQQWETFTDAFWRTVRTDPMPRVQAGFYLDSVGSMEFPTLQLLTDALCRIAPLQDFMDDFYEAFVRLDAAEGRRLRDMGSSRLLTAIADVLFETKNKLDPNGRYVQHIVALPTARLLFLPSVSFTHPDIKMLAGYDTERIYNECGEIVETLTVPTARRFSARFNEKSIEEFQSQITSYFRLRKLRALIDE